ncbi:voltage-gated chloride channel family protein [Halalkalibacter sp. APA_J-10(15)]|uniref:voltage-gated chloride channel family protein n=1 Tax=Halalkalibacter sp. APA_J-10(15) TaxID=2933805 RepID=UPI001FF5F161|nr:voltage-gated chloride channel family protein [Halalkalibacter sp. APA_J-10(15)]MCK0472809.1 voltage-gated chloride channel family protein [Halalkalibacter sp. APA_J-10(15)]
MYKNLFLTLFKWIFFGVIIGLIIGSTTALLLHTNDFLGETRKDNSWLILCLPIAGLVLGYIYMNLGTSAGTELYKGNNLVIEGVHGKTKILRRLGPIVYLGTFMTVLFGGSTGREGAAIQMGGSVAEAVNRFFKVNVMDTKILLMSGISAGFGTAFGTPITGAIFGMEMVTLGKMKYEALVPCLVSSFVGHYTAEKVWGTQHETFIIQSVPELSLMSFAKVILLAILFSLVSVLYSQLRHGIQKVSEIYTKKNHALRAFIGGMIIVALTFIVGSYDYNGRSLDMLEESFKQDVPPYAFLTKLVFTAVTLGTGFVGGEAIPLFFIGATLGNTLYHLIDFPMSFLAALGMIATFCRGTNTPIAAFLLGIEMFDGQGIEFFFVACLTSYLFSGHHGLWPSQMIYEPKSRLYKIANGKTIKDVEQKKRNGC